jgi:hypothetical protein
MCYPEVVSFCKSIIFRVSDQFYRRKFPLKARWIYFCRRVIYQYYLVGNARGVAYNAFNTRAGYLKCIVVYYYNRYKHV